MLDGYEVYTSFSDPLFYDNDSDSDGWYWFEDCDESDWWVFPGAPEELDNRDNDCDEEIDEGFNQSDFDSDGLSDWAEYHFYNTGYWHWDTDGDGLSDGDEVLNWSSDPLFFDNDTDQDGWYWFADCNDTNPSLFPGNPELLDGIDNDCDDDIDEDFYGQDSDGDGLFDLDEYNLIGTDPFHNDTDRDGLFDGDELLVTHTDPLWPDLDEDGDGFRWFDDCDDNDSARSPDANETWNWVDDNCDGDIDEGVNRSPNLQVVLNKNLLNIENESYLVESNFSRILFTLEVTDVNWVMEDLLQNASVKWIVTNPDGMMAQTLGSSTYDVNELNCSEPFSYTTLESIVCPHHNSTVGEWILMLEIQDGDETVMMNWRYSYMIWNPPVEDPIDDEINDDDNTADGENNGTGELGEGGPTISNEIVIGLGAVLVLLIVFMMVTRKKPPKSRPMPKMPELYR
jgi:hypothetical protein